MDLEPSSELARLGAAYAEPFHLTTDFYYSNNNYVLLGILCQEVLNRPLEDAVNEYFQEIGLKNTFMPSGSALPVPYLSGKEFDLSQLGFSPREIDPAALDLELIRNKPLIDCSQGDVNAAWACGNIVSTPQDMVNFFNQLFLGNLLSTEHLKAMTTFAIPRSGGLGYGLGVSELICNGTITWGHNGGMTGYYSHLIFNPQNKRIVVACLGMFWGISGIPMLEDDYLRALVQACVIEDISQIKFEPQQ
jgi:D-alanyl-D-alanine carboxypeptidase